VSTAQANQILSYTLDDSVYRMLLDNKLSGITCAYSATPSYTTGLLSVVQSIVASELTATNSFASTSGMGLMGRAFVAMDLQNTYTMAMINYCGDTYTNGAQSSAHYSPSVFSTMCTSGPTPSLSLTPAQMWAACDGFFKAFSSRTEFGAK